MVDGRLLLDGGAPVLPHLAKLDIDPAAIDVLFLTHFHGDHLLGLPPFFIYRAFEEPRRPLVVVGPPGVEQRLEALNQLAWGEDWVKLFLPKLDLRYQEATAAGTVAGVEYEPVRLDHGKHGCTGYRLRVEGRLLAYSGDSEPTPPLDRLVEGAEVAIVEATGPGDVVTHTSWEAAARLRERHPKTRFFFNHVYAGSVEGAARDLQVIEI